MRINGVMMREMAKKEEGWWGNREGDGERVASCGGIMHIAGVLSSKLFKSMGIAYDKRSSSQSFTSFFSGFEKPPSFIPYQSPELA
jgi:hypothetical protein